MNKLKEYVDRSYSVVTNKRNLEHLYTFKNFPVFFGCTNKSSNEDIVADMVWEIDPESGMIQLSKLVPLDLLYMEQHLNPLGKTWNEYNEAFSEFVINESKSDIIEIGSGNGMIANLLLEKNPNLNLTCVEPNPTFKEKSRLKIIKSFFTSNFKEKLDTNSTIIFSQLYEHIYDPQEFLDQISFFLPIGGKMVFAYPQLEHWFKNKFTNAINFEHMMLMTDYYVDFFLENSGFIIKEKISYKNHSHFYVVEKVQDPLVHRDFTKENRYSFYKEMFQDFIKHHTDMVKKINAKTQKSESPLFLFGGHIFSQFLIQFGLQVDKIINILDNSPIKQNKRLYGTNLEVVSPQILRDYDNPTVILKAGVYNEEIKKDILENINPNTAFI